MAVTRKRLNGGQGLEKPNHRILGKKQNHAKSCQKKEGSAISPQKRGKRGGDGGEAKPVQERAPKGGGGKKPNDRWFWPTMMEESLQINEGRDKRGMVVRGWNIFIDGEKCIEKKLYDSRRPTQRRGRITQVLNQSKNGTAKGVGGETRVARQRNGFDR